MSDADDEFGGDLGEDDFEAGEPAGEASPAQDDYKVGYRKPPLHTQFKKGQSGNPQGRKKGSRGLKTDLHAELNRVVEVTIGKYRLKGTTQQLAIRTLALLAANGNLKASAQLIPLVLTVFGTEDRGADKRVLSAHDQAILDNFLAAFGGDSSGALEPAGSGHPLDDAPDAKPADPLPSHERSEPDRNEEEQ